MFLLYFAMGGTAVFTFPVTLWLDRYVITPLSASATPSEGAGSGAATVAQMTAEVKLLFSLFLLFLLFAAGSAIAALWIGGGALPQHLTYAP